MNKKEKYVILFLVLVLCAMPVQAAENVRVDRVWLDSTDPIYGNIGIINIQLSNMVGTKQTITQQVSWAFLNGNYGSFPKETISLDPYRLTIIKVPMSSSKMMMPYNWKDTPTRVGYSVSIKDASGSLIIKKVFNAEIDTKRGTVTDIVSVKPGTTVTPTPAPQKPAITYNSGNGLQVNYVAVDPYIIKKNNDLIVRAHFTNYHGQVDAAGRYYPAFFNFQVCYETTNVVNGITLTSKQCLPMSNPGAYTWNGNGDQHCSWNGVQGRDLHLECDNRYQIDPNGVMTIDTGLNWKNLNIQMNPDPSIMQGAWKKVKFTVTAYKHLDCGLPTCTKSSDWIVSNFGEAWVQIVEQKI